MQGHCEIPYQTMLILSRAIHQLPPGATEWHLRQLSTELADAVLDLDTRLRAGLIPPWAWNATLRDLRSW